MDEKKEEERMKIFGGINLKSQKKNPTLQLTSIRRAKLTPPIGIGASPK